MESVYYREFDTKEAAQAACHAVAKAQGFALVIRSGRASACYMTCSKAGEYRDNTDPGAHKTKSRPNQSTQSAVSSSRDHDHPFTPAVTHSGYRAELIAEHHGHIVRLYNTGLKPFQIATHLRGLALIKNPDLKFITGQHIRNAIAAYRVRELAGRTPLQFLYDQLKDLSLGFFFRDTRDQEGRLTDLFIAPRTGIELWRRFPNILLLDCTYKTNRFKMPLLNTCGSTSEKTFSVASVFLSGEAEPQYRWALQCLLDLAAEEGIPLPRVIVTDRELALMNALVSFSELAPVIHLLCRWHINKNVLAQSKQYFPKATKDEWNELINAPDEATYDIRLQAFTAQTITQRRQWIMR
ncbi:MULE transposase [Hirsutella rhossiliensis]|uniref:MULE transposase domain-containing protein n=1 Tax=Hirsutella rhossiliensis TaxID=111463 RepID=A0A9P8MRQ6_9HYPO|nr:MULE transposase domain-containing protein [Hirsutella rhossiliensis]KAH0959264.1 MULE transposase domain-containing protein [Hirsutella rhossiliensis]